ncbi:MAG TPA: class II aldolase/adducin family protein [Alphaproteobacteria bacterium]
MDLSKTNSGEMLRTQLAAATRIMNMENVLEYSGHISVRVPGRDALYIQQRTESRAEVSPDSVLMVDFDCNVIEGKGKPPSETVIHAEILRARPEVNAIIHNHMELAIAFTMMKGVTMLPMRSRAARWASGIPLHSDPSHIKRLEQGQALVKTLGDHNAALMRTHGMVLVAESVAALTADTIHFEENARAMMDVLQAGKEPIPLSEEDMELINRNEDRDHHVHKLWNYYVNKAKKGGNMPTGWDIEF